MTTRLDLRQDFHTHSTTSDGAASIADMLDAAERAGLRQISITDHVRASTDWVADYVREVDTQRSGREITVVCGVEAKILDTRGSVDVPADLRGVEQLVIADHQFPTRKGPVTPSEIARSLGAGRLRASDALEDLILATSRAVFRHERVVVGHLFSVLPKAGLDVEQVSHEMLESLASACRASGAVIEVNEKWRTPSVAVIRTLSSLGVEFVASSDAHHPSAIGSWDHVAQVADTVDEPVLHTS